MTNKGESKFAFNKGSILVSYKSRSKKNVIVLSNMHNNTNMVSKPGKKKLPEVVSFYNATKGVSGLSGLMAHAMTAKRQTKRWTIVIFYNILDMASVGASVLIKSEFPDHRLSE